jgi:hypothetical protein
MSGLSSLGGELVREGAMAVGRYSLYGDCDVAGLGNGGNCFGFSRNIGGKRHIWRFQPHQQLHN